MRNNQAPSQIFRYRGYTAADLLVPQRRIRLDNDIKHATLGEVWFSPLAAQNDPFDTNVHYVDSNKWEIAKFYKNFVRKNGRRASFSGMNYIELAKAFGVKINNVEKIARDPAMYKKTIRKIIAEHKQRQKIACFSRKADNVLLWSYYSSSHSSFCFGFSCSSEERNQAKIIGADVKYIRERPQITTLEILELMTSKDGEEDPVITNKYLDAFMLTKSDVWKHEVEWRAVTQKGREGYKSIKPYKLTSVIFGCKSSEALVQHIQARLPDTVSVERLSLDNKKYALKGFAKL